MKYAYKIIKRKTEIILFIFEEKRKKCINLHQGLS